MYGASILNTSDAERAEEYLEQSADPDFCDAKGGEVETITATSWLELGGDQFLRPEDTPWGRYGAQNSFRDKVNSLGLASDGAVRVCNVGEIGDGQRQELYVYPDQQDAIQLRFLLSTDGSISLAP